MIKVNHSKKLLSYITKNYYHILSTIIFPSDHLYFDVIDPIRSARLLMITFQILFNKIILLIIDISILKIMLNNLLA